MMTVHIELQLFKNKLAYSCGVYQSKKNTMQRAANAGAIIELSTKI